MDIRILGPLEVVGDDGSVALPEGRARSLFAILALQPGQVASTDALLDRLWGARPPATARTKLYGLVSALRRALHGSGGGLSPVHTRTPGYVLDVDRDEIDAFRFRRMVQAAVELPAQEKAAALRDALDLWRGQALAEFTYEPFAQAEIASLEELRLTAIEDRIAAELDLGHHAALVSELETLVRRHPFRERVLAHAMVALYRSGNQQKALSVYRDAYSTLVDELGVEPGPELQRLEEAILNHDPALQVVGHTVLGETTRSEREADLGIRPWLLESRRPVTVVYVDLRSPSAESDVEADRLVARGAHERITEALRRHGGSTQGSIGGVHVSVFGMPTAHEDDPSRAVRAAVEVVRSMSDPAPWEGAPMWRIGVNTGEVVVGNMGAAAPSHLPGNVVRIAARLQQSAAFGEILIGDRTRRLVGSAITVEPVRRRILDDAGERIRAWRLVDAVPVSHATAGPGPTPLVGRDVELARLRDAFEEVVAGGSPRRLTVLGAAGVGKSRLAWEFAAGVAERGRVLTGHCPPYGEGITFWPLREMVQGAAGGATREALQRLLDPVENPDAIMEDVAAAVGSTDVPPRPDVLFPSLRRLFEALARDRPLVLVIEDFHWAQPTFLDLVDYSADFVDGPVLFLCLARPELREHAPWVDDGDRAETLELEPLGNGHVERLIELTSAGHPLAHDRVREVVEMAGGNPLFAQQIVAALREDGEVTIPPSIQGLLLARLDALGPAEQSLIRAASVIGRDFDVADLAHLLPGAAHGSLEAHLLSLERKELISRHGETGGAIFRHALIQLAAYRTLTKDARARLHEEFADILDRGAGGDVTTIEELAGYHLERAVGYRRDLGIDDAHSTRLATRAGERLARAGLRAFGRFDVPAAETLLSRAERLLPPDHPARRDVMRSLVETDQVMGRHDKAVQVLDTLVQEAMRAGDEARLHFLRLERAWAHIAAGPDPVTLEQIEEDAALARDVFEALGDETGLAQVCRVMLHVHHRRGDVARMEETAYQGLDHAGRSTSAREQLGAQWLVAIALEEGPRPVEECIRRCEAIPAPGDVENPGVVSALGYFRAMAGDFAEGRRLISRAREILRERVRARRPLGHVLHREADVELLSGDLDAGMAKMRDALGMNQAMGENDVVCQVAAVLARLELLHGDGEQAERLAELSRAHAPRQSVASQSRWRSATAGVMALQGDPAAASLAEEAVRLVPPEMLDLRAELSVSRGEVLLRLGRRGAGERAIREGIELYERKGNLASARRAAGSIG